MDESKAAIPPNERHRRPASGLTSAAVDSLPADFAKSDHLVLRGRRHADPPNGSSGIVYCGNEAEVSRGFLIALRAMGIAVVEQPLRPTSPAVARAKP